MNTFCLCLAEPTQAETENITLIYSSGTSRVVWNLDGVFCTVKSWQRSTDPKKETVNFVKKCVKRNSSFESLSEWANKNTLGDSYLVLKKKPRTRLTEHDAALHRPTLEYS